jgi:hypothetical protein
MTETSLSTFARNVHGAWRPLSTELIDDCRGQAEALVGAAVSEPWLAALHARRPDSEELYRDPDHGFVLLAHTEHAGLYRPPHDHGCAWVIYAVQQGESEMGTYARIQEGDGRVRLVKRNSTMVRAGEVQVYLPGDIHDTLCVSSSALLFRFTSRDLKVEDQEAHRVTRYVDRDGVWTAPA